MSWFVFPPVSTETANLFSDILRLVCITLLVRFHFVRARLDILGDSAGYRLSVLKAFADVPLWAALPIWWFVRDAPQQAHLPTAILPFVIIWLVTLAGVFFWALGIRPVERYAELKRMSQAIEEHTEKTLSTMNEEERRETLAHPSIPQEETSLLRIFLAVLFALAVFLIYLSATQ